MYVQFSQQHRILTLATFSLRRLSWNLMRKETVRLTWKFNQKALENAFIQMVLFFEEVAQVFSADWIYFDIHFFSWFSVLIFFRLSLSLQVFQIEIFDSISSKFWKSLPINSWLCLWKSWKFLEWARTHERARTINRNNWNNPDCLQIISAARNQDNKFDLISSSFESVNAIKLMDFILYFRSNFFYSNRRASTTKV